jgi:nicotinamidase-related amidase
MDAIMARPRAAMQGAAPREPTAPAGHRGHGDIARVPGAGCWYNPVMTRTAIDRGRAVIAIIDVQDRLSAAMPADVCTRAVRNAHVLLELARRFSLPVVVSEQYPRGLGATVGALGNAIQGLPRLHRLEKVEFSLVRAPGFAAVRKDLGAGRQWLLAGMETHVCVYQSARDLIAAGDDVQVVGDAVVSRATVNWKTGLGLMAAAGALVTCTETVVVDVLGAAGGDDFKALSSLIR